MIYACGHEDCSGYGIPRLIEDDDAVLAADDFRRACGGTVMVGTDKAGYEACTCGRPLDALLGDGEVDHIDAPAPVPAPPKPEEPVVESSPDPLIPASVAVQTAVAAVMATVKITSPTLTKAQTQQIQDNVTAAAQRVVDDSLGG